MKKEEEIRNLIRKQLTIRAVAVDIDPGLRGSKELSKLEQELLQYQIQEIPADMLYQLAEMPADIPDQHIKALASMYVTESMNRDGKVQKAELLKGILEKVQEEMVFVTDKRMRAKQLQERTGMAIIYYEGNAKEGDEICSEADIVVQGFQEIGVQFLDRVLKRRRQLPWNILYTKRTLVREITLDDLDELYELYGGEGITSYIEDLYEREKEEAYTLDYIRYRYAFFGYGMWIIRHRETGALIGRAGIEEREDGDAVYSELGYVIGRRYQNQGYATEVCRAILSYAAKELELPELYCFIHPENTPSIRVALKLGFSKKTQVLQEKGELDVYYRIL